MAMNLRMKVLLCFIGLSIANCSESGSVVVVTVDAAQRITGIAKIEATASIDRSSQQFQFRTANQSTPIDFAIELPPSLSGTIAVAVVLKDSTENVLGSGQESATILKGKRADLLIRIGNAPDDMAVTPDIAPDIADMGCLPTVDVLAGSGAGGFADGTGTNASFWNPNGIAADSTAVYVADYKNHRIRKIRRSDGFTETLAGDGTEGFLDGAGQSAKFRYPTGVAVDGTGNVYVADSGNCRIRKVQPNGTTSTLAGNASCAFADGSGSSASFFSPIGVAVNAAGTVFVADAENHRIRRVLGDGTTSTLAGTGVAGFMDGVGSVARFSTPTGVAVDASGNVFVADMENHRIRKVASDGTTTTLAGGANADLADGPGPIARFNSPWAITLGSNGDLFVADTLNDRIRRVTADGTTTSLGIAGGRQSRGVAFDGNQLFYSSTIDHRIRRVSCIQ